MEDIKKYGQGQAQINMLVNGVIGKTNVYYLIEWQTSQSSHLYLYILTKKDRRFCSVRIDTFSRKKYPNRSLVSYWNGTFSSGSPLSKRRKSSIGNHSPVSTICKYYNSTSRLEKKIYYKIYKN